MTRHLLPAGVLLAALGGAGVGCAGRPLAQAAAAEGITRTTLHMAPFGDVHVLRGTARPAREIVFVSGDGGWDGNAEAVADVLASSDALVVGIDVDELRDGLRGALGCADLSESFGRLATHVGRGAGRTRRSATLLAGHSAGATVAFAALAQDVRGRFAGAVSLGFAPVLELPIPPCHKGSLVASPLHNGEFRLSPGAVRNGRWWLLQGEDDGVTPPGDARTFAEGVAGAHFVLLPGQGHSFADDTGWVATARAAIDSLAPRRARGVGS